MSSDYHFYPSNPDEIIKELGPERLIQCLKKMLLIRNFEIRAEAAYQQGHIGGFFHSYIGQEAIQMAATEALTEKNWWITSYRCHALALLLGATTNEIMAELYGRKTGNARGRGGSMHLYTERLLGGFGIVGGQIPIATGAAFTIKYKNLKDEVAICFLGDGAVAQGAFHESLNLAALWKLPCIYVIENNLWGMGTAVNRAISVLPIAEKKASSFGIKGYSLDGTDFFNCFSGFKKIKQEVLNTSEPVLIEVIAQRFKGHSISDPGAYRSNEELKKSMQKDPIKLLGDRLVQEKFITEEEIKIFDKEARQKCIDSMKYAEESPWPDISTLEEDVFAK